MSTNLQGWLESHHFHAPDNGNRLVMHSHGAHTCPCGRPGSHFDNFNISEQQLCFLQNVNAKYGFQKTKNAGCSQDKN